MKDNVMRIRKQASHGKKYFQKTYLIKNYYLKYYKELFKFTHKETNNLVFKMRPKSTSHQRRYTDGKKHMKR